jgi:hypothetical protein
MRKLVCAAVVTLAAVGFAAAEEFTAMITKCDADKGCIEYKKVTGKGADKKVDETVKKADLTKDCKIMKGMFDKETKTVKDGDVIEKGLKNDLFAKEGGVFATITIADDGADKGKVTKIRVGGGGKKKQ